MPRSVQAPDFDQIGFLLGRAYYSYIGLLQRRLDELSLSAHLKPGMGSLLFCLFHRDNRTLSELAAELQIARSTVTGIVASMKDAGVLTTSPDPEDGRSVRLTLTPLAMSLRPRCMDLAKELESLLVRKLTKAEQELFRQALKLVIQAISERLPDGQETKQHIKGRIRSASVHKRRRTVKS